MFASQSAILWASPAHLASPHYQSNAAARELRVRTRRPHGIAGPVTESPAVSRSFLRTTLRQQAVISWRDCIIRGCKGRRPYRIPREGMVPRIPTVLGRTEKSLASRYFQLASGHAMTAPFLRDKFGWVDDDQCWWCSSGRQSREHLFKECRTWKNEIKELWKEVGDISNDGGNMEGGPQGRRKRRKGFGFFSQENRIRPGNCTVGRLLGDARFTEAVLKFLRNTKVGLIKKGVIVRGEEAA